MQILIFTSLNNLSILQEIMNWGSTNKHIKFQMFFVNDINKLLFLTKNIKHDFIVTTESSVARSLKNAGIKGLLVKKEWYAKLEKLNEI